MPARKEWIKLECKICGKKFTVMPYRLSTAKTCSRRCANTYISRISVIDRANKQRNRGNNKTYKKWFGRHLHRVMAETIVGRKLLKGEIVHHRDGNIFNNDISNLEITTQANHVKLHINKMLFQRKIKAGY